MSKPVFDDWKLNKIYAVMNESIDEVNTKLDKISSDIKKLEDICKKCPVSFFTHALPKDLGCLLWKGKRLIFEKNGVEKPLIETKAETRVSVSPYLSDFFKEFVDCMRAKTMGGENAEG